MKRYIYLVLVLGIFFSECSKARPDRPQNYTLLRGGAIELTDGAVIEGSSEHGGIQPDYIIDLKSPKMKTFLAGARRIKKELKNEWNSRILIEKIVEYVSKQIKGKDYDDRDYLRLLGQYNGKNVPLSKYLECSSGVCREHGLLLHFALNEAGIVNQHVYAQVSQNERTEDHSFVVTKLDGKIIAFDAYNTNFNNLEFNRLLDGMNIGGVFRKVNRVNSYPQVWIPNTKIKRMHSWFVDITPNCRLLFHRLVN